MKVITQNSIQREKEGLYFGYWLEKKDHISLSCIRHQDGYGYWHDVIHKSKRKLILFDYVIARIYRSNDVHLYRPQYFSDIEQFAQEFERETGNPVTACASARKPPPPPYPEVTITVFES